MPGCYLPDVTQLHLYHLDWMITRPHDCFFDFLTLYSGVTELHLFSCRFKHASELRRLINALPRLETLKLSAIDGSTLCDIPTTAVSRPTLKANQNLQEIILHDSTRDMGLSTLMDSRVAIRNIIAFCTQYSSISRLTLKHGFLNSPACFLQLLRNLPPLSSLKVDGSFAYLDNSEWHGFQLEQADIGALHRLTRRCFSTFSLERILTTPALHLMKLISTPEACSQLVSLTVKHGDGTGPVAQLLQAVMDTLRLAGTALSEFIFVWDCDPDLLAGRILELDFTPNTSLGDVNLRLQMPPSPHMIERTLISIISSITSPNLKLLQVTLDIADIGASDSEAHQPFNNDGDVSQYKGSEALNAPRFHDLPSGRIDIRIWASGSVRTTGRPMIEVMVLVKSRLDKLFAPWFARNVLRVSYHPDLDTSGPTKNIHAHAD
ncbi:hypothetical protein FOMPIDRAFT_1055987 [Fomitopsis schrenkii]|uniref:F-box domain-containing protein n=1 Tax=Fomitopsis schrenkii TaxID=2126942 RepID=S8EUT6_FOMSC|nr:hypothetical protein FOMPIDRAFT_1055987 [Fomitopsis schrenkii]